MARKSGTFNRFLNFIGLVDEEPVEEQIPPRKVQPEESRQRYGATSSYQRGRDSSKTEDGSAYGSSGRAARYRTDAPSSASGRQERFSGYASASSFERNPYDDRRARASTSRQPIDEVDELETAFESQPQRRGAPQTGTRSNRQMSSIPVRNEPSRASASQMMVFNLHALDDCRAVINILLENRSIVLNMEDTDDRILQRAIDTLGGAAFAMNATLRQVSFRTYLIAPKNVDIASYANDRPSQF